MEHTDLIRNLKNGDAKSLELLFRRLYPRLCAYARKFLHDEQDAEEIVQDLFVNLWKQRERIDEHKSLHKYLFTAARNGCLNFLHAKKIRSRSAEIILYLYGQDVHDHIDSYHALLAKDLEQDFNEALQRLPTECRRIFELSRTDGLRYEEIALRLNISIKTVETQMSRALSRLRLQLKEHITVLILLSLLK
ncbi:RNA polymerase sigma-70 factor [Fulvivirgaceae bacterium PWU4]|uniref:RNA polymerase sigma-70 factor n=1 Tax=Chryseosolibacter histidini TaxID=2782349 RepID=A0AAP2GJU5_9BACT|nr:RNA polymerase sigma-70 factor [Chryseosolibacter histidini]MBT1698706.1 RNA polymerase sigma-70 factor [Chryseosolibacter histidini]